jgi:arylformamidase
MPVTRALRLALLALLICASPYSVANAHEHPQRHAHVRAPAFPGETAFSLIWYQDAVYDETSPDPVRTSLDLYVPEPQRTGVPVVVFMHGGGFRGGDKAWFKDLGEMPTWFTQEMGYIFVSMNYRFLPDGGYPIKEQDTANAIGWLAENVSAYGGDPNEIIVLGHAPGTYLASIVATDGAFLENAGHGLNVLRGVIVLDDAYYDVTERAGDAAFPSDADGLRRASPIFNVSAGKGIPPFLLLHAGRQEYREQAQEMGAALEAAGVRADVVEVQGKTHLSIVGDLGKPGDAVTLIVRHFLDSLADN